MGYDLNNYQEEAVKLAIYPADVWDSYLPLQLASEAGEVAAEFAKPQRKGLDYNLDNIAHELGDVLWYVANIANEIGLTLDEIADLNIEKLSKRHNKDLKEAKHK